MHQDLIILSHSLSNFVVGMEGNTSKKTKDGFSIKASGEKLKMVDENSFVDYDFDGNQISNFKKKGSIEVGFHQFILKNFDVKFIAHTHPTQTLKILCSNKADDFSKKRIFPDQVVFNGEKSCLVPYANPGSELTVAVINSINEFIDEEKFFPKLILLKNHGIISCGKSIEECLIITEICEKSAEIFLSPFEVDFFTETQIQSIINDDNEIYRQKLIL
jgi:L-fuculose-phosphate aldolase